MATESVGKKLSELRVFDLKEELGNRSLEVHGNKVELVKRLQQVCQKKWLPLFDTNQITMSQLKSGE